MSEFSETQIVEKDSEETPSHFLSRVYGNDHLATREGKEFHQVKLPKGIKKWAEENELEEKDYIAIPIGSSRTLPNGKSDIDLVVVLNKENESEEDENNYLRLNMLTRTIKGDEMTPSVQVVWTEKSTAFKIIPKLFNNRGYILLGKKFSGLVADLLFTPDEMIHGNKELAQKMRLDAIDFVEKYGNHQHYWEDGVVRYFKRNILEWYKCNDANKKEERESRFYSSIENQRQILNKKNDGLGDKWEKAFVEYLRDLKVPSFESFKENLRSNNGKLSVKNSRFFDDTP